MIITLLTGKTSKIKEKVKDKTGIELDVSISSRSKKLSLKIDNKTKMPSLTIPKFCSEKRAVEFVLTNQNWINEKLMNLTPSKRFQDGDTIQIFGKEIKIKHDEKSRSGVQQQDNFLIVSGQESFIHRRVIDYVKKISKEKFSNLSKEKAQKIGCKINNITIKDTKSRWGSCSSNNNLNYSWRIAFAPDFVFDYLVSHEVAHLKHMDHSRAFWETVKILCPTYLQGKNWLKINGKTLYSYE